MAFSGGTFSRTFDCTTDRDNGVKILASKFDTELDGFATGLSTCILKDGTQTCTAAIPFAEGLTVPDNKTIILGTNSDITIQYDESTNDSLEIAANVEGAALGIVLKADQGDDNADQHKVSIADGGTLTLGSKISGSFVSYLTHTPNSTVASSTTAVAGNLTVGGDLTLGSGAVISEAELEAIDGVTAGTVAASKAVIVDSNKDIASFRNVTLTGELDAGSLDISGDADIDGTLEADAMTLNGTAITATATLDTGISNNNVPKFTSGVADDDFLRVAGTAIEGRSASEVLSDIGAAPAAGSSNIVTTGALNSGSITSGFGTIDTGSSNITTTGVGSFGSLDISGDIDVDGTTNLDAVDIDGAVDMASTLTVSGAFTSPGIDDNADATAITIDSSENVGIGTTSPAATTHSHSSSAGGGHIRSSSSNLNNFIDIGTDSGGHGVINVGTAGGTMNFETAGTERMRIDSNGHTMFATTDNVVQTNSGTGNGGVVIRGGSNPYIAVASDGSAAGEFNRLANDGVILNLRKDGTTVGSIGAASGDLTIHGDVGIRFSGDDVRPLDSSGAQADNSVDLGHHDVRWQDLYLGGNLYIGGTGSANALDDYETGTFTPRFQQGLTSAGYSSQEGTYVKIGSLVVCSIYLRANSGTENGDHIYVGGLPFTVITGTGIDHQYGAFFTYNGGFWSSDANTQWLARANETNLAFYKQADGGAIQGTTSGVATNLNADLRLVAVYRA